VGPAADEVVFVGMGTGGTGAVAGAKRLTERPEGDGGRAVRVGLRFAPAAPPADTRGWASVRAVNALCVCRSCCASAGDACAGEALTARAAGTRNKPIIICLGLTTAARMAASR
jgi:hypothetical protein